MLRIAITVVIALTGVWVFLALRLPLPWLLGPMSACLIAALVGVPLRSVSVVNHSMRTIMGIAVGASFTPALLASMLGYWPTLLMIPAMLLVIAAIGVPYFQRICGYDFATAYYASMPGGLQDMLIFGEEAGGNPRALSLIHATRVLVIVMALPALLTFIWQVDLDRLPGAPIADVSLDQIAIMVACGWIGWRVAKRVGLFGASILGPLILTAIVTLLGGLNTRPPAEAIWASQFFIGMAVGQKYSGITLAEIRRDILAGIGYCVILLVLTLIIVELIYQSGLAPAMEAVLSFAPGGQVEMIVLALIVGADMAFVVAHHVLRVVLVISLAPVFARFFKKA